MNGGDFELKFVTTNRQSIGVMSIHVLILQRVTLSTRSALLYIDASSVLSRFRAVLYDADASALDVFVAAHLHRPCVQGEAFCILTDSLYEPVLTCEDHQPCPFGDARFLEASIRILTESSDEAAEDSLTEASTDVGGSCSDEDSDTNSLMSIIPQFTLQLDQQNHYPWQIEDDQIQIDEQDDDIEDVFFMNGAIEDISQHVQESTAPVALGPQGWLLITFGLGLTDLGRRDGQVNGHDWRDIRREVRELWSDHARHGFLDIQCVVPQPRLVERAALTLIVKVTYGDLPDPHLSAVLVMEESSVDFSPRSSPYLGQ